jgi:hypothetical protein
VEFVSSDSPEMSTAEAVPTIANTITSATMTLSPVILFIIVPFSVSSLNC